VAEPVAICAGRWGRGQPWFGQGLEDKGVEEGGLAYDTVRQQGAATQMELTSGEKIGAMGRSSVLIPERGGRG
jgi:hypothetical protein